MKLRQNNLFLKFPMTMTPDGLQKAGRAEHIRDQIELMLFTAPGERVLRPEYGAGTQRLVFEPNESWLCQLTEKRIQASLTELLAREAMSESIDVKVEAIEEKLFISISYTLAAFDLKQEFTFSGVETRTVKPGTKEWDHSLKPKEPVSSPSLKLNFSQDAQGRWRGERIVRDLPADLPVCEDDFDWRQRDFDSIRVAMLQDLKRSFPQRSEWSASDFETVLVELLAYGLDIISDKADRVMNEAFLETALDPARIKQFADFLGYNSMADLPEDFLSRFTSEDAAVIAWWKKYPHIMERVRRNAPASVVKQERMVTVADYQNQLEDHPLVEQSQASSEWDGSAEVITVSLILAEGLELDTPMDSGKISDTLWADLQTFHKAIETDALKNRPDWMQTGLCWMPNLDEGHTPRLLLGRYINMYRMAGRRVELANSVAVPIDLQLTVTAHDGFYESEVLLEVRQALGINPGGFFEPGRLGFGEPVTIGDVMEWVMNVEGVANVQVERLKAAGNRPDTSGIGQVVLRPGEVAVAGINGAPKPVIRLQGGVQG